MTDHLELTEKVIMKCNTTSYIMKCNIYLGLCDMSKLPICELFISLVGKLKPFFKTKLNIELLYRVSHYIMQRGIVMFCFGSSPALLGQ